jgi:hypothetical protein
LSVKQATEAAAIIYSKGLFAFSPLTHSYPIWKLNNKITPHTWMGLDLQILPLCSHLLVLMLPGWEESIGIKLEREVAFKLNLKIRYFASLQSIQNFEFTKE